MQHLHVWGCLVVVGLACQLVLSEPAAPIAVAATSPTTVVESLRRAAEQGNAVAQHNLGLCYDYGTGVEKDGREAVKWYRKAAEQGYADA